METKYLVNLLRQKKKGGNTVFICGNGGSASTAEHFTNDLFSEGVKAVCLNSNTSIMTMIANDYGYEYVFSKQLQIYAELNDLLIVISCSGKSKNIVRAMQVGVETIIMFGYEHESYQETENRHLALVHEISERI